MPQTSLGPSCYPPYKEDEESASPFNEGSEVSQPDLLLQPINSDIAIVALFTLFHCFDPNSHIPIQQQVEEFTTGLLRL